MQEQITHADAKAVAAPWVVPPRILVVDDEPDACEALRLVLMSKGYGVTQETSANRALEKVATEEFDLVVSDVTMSEMDGLDLCRRVVDTRPGLPVILVTGRDSMNTVVGALRSGASDFLSKPVQVESLIASVARVLRGHARKDQDSRSLPALVVVPSRASSRPLRALALDHQAHAPELAGSSAERALARLLGQSEGMRGLRRLITDLAGSVASVVIQGETGTGKELVARAIHENSRLSGGPFVALNCAAMPAGLLESELFGYVRGAFTDAKTARAGLLVQANGGTLLLDEIGELPLAMQPKLLRALQERTVRPVGGHQEIPFDCRIITATNQDLDAEVAAKRFREDLYYRLDVVRVSVPPLRERGDDVLLLARHLLERAARGSGRHITLHAEAAEKLLAYGWPGNVRELENCLERAVALARTQELTVGDFPQKVQLSRTEPQEPAKTLALPGVASLFELERVHTLRAVEQLEGNMTRAAKLLGIDRTTLYRRLRRYEPT